VNVWINVFGTVDMLQKCSVCRIQCYVVGNFKKSSILYVPPCINHHLWVVNSTQTYLWVVEERIAIVRTSSCAIRFQPGAMEHTVTPALL